MNEMIITSAQYIEENGKKIAITAIIDGVTWGVSIDASNRHYAEIMRQVEAGTLTIQEAE